MLYGIMSISGHYTDSVKYTIPPLCGYGIITENAYYTAYCTGAAECAYSLYNPTEVSPK